ncbi:MAG: carboxymuconolactone decarboxylase family protein, partial [Acidobacteriales bacterium]|nr:carboxymuconolactone decarboxylase family protein [Terriglobales bacterium]
MTRLKPVDPAGAQGPTKEALDAVNEKMGKIPNIFQLMANAPAAVQGYLKFSEALSTGILSPQVREQIAITCAEVNECEYCLSAHVAIARSIGMTNEEVEKARTQRSADPKTDAMLVFVRTVLLRKADIPDADLDMLRAAGVSDGEIAEIIANVALNIFT